MSKAFANMYKDEAALVEVAISAIDDWYLMDLPSLVDIPNNDGIILDSNGQFHNQTGRQLRLLAGLDFTMASASGTPIFEISLGINNGAGYATNGDDLYDDGQRFRNSGTNTTQKSFSHQQTAIIDDDEKFGFLIRNNISTIYPAFRYWSFTVKEV